MRNLGANQISFKIVPGVTQQKVQSIKDSLRRNQANQLVAALQQVPVQQMPAATPSPSPANMPLSNGAVTN